MKDTDELSSFVLSSESSFANLVYDKPMPSQSGAHEPRSRIESESNSAHSELAELNRDIETIPPFKHK
jgi:hypothetical protein